MNNIALKYLIDERKDGEVERDSKEIKKSGSWEMSRGMDG